MAKATKTAAKKTAAKKTAVKNTAENSHQPRVQVKVPAGFIQPDTGNYNPHDFDAIPILQGIVTDRRIIHGKKKNEGDRILLVVDRADGSGKCALWQSHALKPLMETVDVGDEIFVQYLGTKELKGGRTLKEYAYAFKAGTKASKKK